MRNENITISKIDSVSADAEWESYISSTPKTTYAEKIAWRNVLVETYGLKDHFLVARRDKDIVGVLALLLNKGVLKGSYATTCPLSSSGGGLHGDSQEVINGLLMEVDRLITKEHLSHVVLRLLNPIGSFPKWRVYRGYATFLMDISGGEEKVWKTTIRSKTRNQIRKAQKYGFEICLGHEFAPDFAKVLHDGTKELGSPCPGLKLFEMAIRHFGKDVEFIVIKNGDCPVAGTVLFHFGKTVSNPWASSLKEYRPQCVNSLLYWEIIKSALARGMTSFDLGRCKIGTGTYNFKRRLGAVEVPLYYYYLNTKEKPRFAGQDSRGLSLASSLWRHLPDFITTHLGQRIIKELI